jgi:hypothetical protein
VLGERGAMRIGTLRRVAEDQRRSGVFGGFSGE